MAEKQPVVEFTLIVQDHNTKEFTEDKPDEITVALEAPEKSFNIGLQDAKAKLKIKAFDDIVKHDLPLGGIFTCKIYRKITRAAEVKASTKPTQLVPGADKGEL